MISYSTGLGIETESSQNSGCGNTSRFAGGSQQSFEVSSVTCLLSQKKCGGEDEEEVGEGGDGDKGPELGL